MRIPADRELPPILSEHPSNPAERGPGSAEQGATGATPPAVAAEQFAIPFVKAIVVVGERFLMQRRIKPGDLYRGYWELPGGKMRLGETAEAALRREISEETGLRLVTVLDQPRSVLADRFGRSARIVKPLITVEIVSGPAPCLGHYFACRAEGEPADSAEGDTHRLIRPEEFQREFLAPGAEGCCTTLDLLAMRIILEEGKLDPFLQASS